MVPNTKMSTAPFELEEAKATIDRLREHRNRLLQQFREQEVLTEQYKASSEGWQRDADKYRQKLDAIKAELPALLAATTIRDAFRAVELLRKIKGLLDPNSGGQIVHVLKHTEPPGWPVREFMEQIWQEDKE